MASPQVEDGFTRIANELLDAVIGFPFSKRQLLVVLCVIRKTYGYNKKADTMTNGEIARATNINRRHVVSTLAELADMRVLSLQKSGVEVRGGELNLVSINKRYSDWLTSADSATSQDGTTSADSATSAETALVLIQYPTSAETAPVTSADLATLKRQRKKTIQKTKIDALFDEWYQHYPKKVARGQALKAFRKLRPTPDLVRTMISAVKAQTSLRASRAASGEWVPEWKHPGTWLNGQCWQDDVGSSDDGGFDWSQVDC
jgi:phage replication O-like protein O